MSESNLLAQLVGKRALVQHKADRGPGLRIRVNLTLGELEKIIDALTRAETPQSIPSEREEMLKWLDSRVVEHDRREPGSAFDSGRASAFYEAKQAIERGEHLTRQALEQGSAK